MSSNPKLPSPAQMRRQIERLEAKVAALESERGKMFDAYREQLYVAVDLRVRCEQAMRILSGEDDT